MLKTRTNLLLLFICWAVCSINGEELPDISTVPKDLVVPKMISDFPARGLRVRQTAEKYAASDIYHTLYLPTNWRSDDKYPVIVEYAGNGYYKNDFGDRCSGGVEDCNLGYGISGGKDYIWVCMPFVSEDQSENQLKWWGNIDASVDYCKEVVEKICHDYGGDRDLVFLAGFSRGSIACNYIGLHDDEIAALWRGFICHSHYDGVKLWSYPDSSQYAAELRLARLHGRPQFISHEGSVSETKYFLQEVCPTGDFTFQTIPYRNHTDKWVLRDIPERKAVRKWLKDILESDLE